MMQISPQDMTDGEFQQFSEFIEGEFGISLSPSKKALLVSRLSKKIERLGLPNFSTYLQQIKGFEKSSSEYTSFVSSVTTNMTHFQRESHHFDHLSKIALPGIAKRRRKSVTRLWSAACSSGEEAFQMAFSCFFLNDTYPDFEFQILATDLDSTILNRAKRSEFSNDQIEILPNSWIERFFGVSSTSTMTLKKSVRDKVAFNTLNLQGPWPIKFKMDVIFCRNVAIYFSETSTERLWSRMADGLFPGGWLYIGHSESIARNETLNLINHGRGIYQKLSDGEEGMNP